MQINAVVFRHSHRLANGTIVTHAHPYNIFGKSCPLSPNPHSTHELLLLDAISNPTFVPAFSLVAVFLLLTGFLIQSIAPGLTPGLVTTHLARPQLRGPPTFLFY